MLLMDATLRGIQSPPVVYSLLVDAKNDQAVAFYRRFGFRPLVDPMLFLPLATAEKALLGRVALQDKI